MVIETKYDYTYYTVIDVEQWRRENEEWLGYDDCGFTLDNAINFINHKFKISKDESVNNFKVEYAGYEQDINAWINAHERHKERTVFVRFQEDQQIKTTGKGSLFVLYEKEDDEEEEEEECDTGYYNPPTEIENNYGSSDCPDGPYYGLAGLGGRL